MSQTKLTWQKKISYPKEDSLSRIRLDGNIVIGYHSHFMLVDREELLPSSSSIDQPYSMRLSFLERELCEGGIVRAGPSVINTGAIETHLAINKIVVRVLTPFGLIRALDYIG